MSTQRRGSSIRALPTASLGAFALMMWAAALASGVLALVFAVIASVFGPVGSVGSSVAGVLVAAAFLAMGAYGVRIVLAGPDSGFITGALAIYLIQVSGLLAVLLVTPKSAVSQPGWFAVAAIVEAVVWQSAQAVALRRARVLAYSGLSMPSAVDDSLPRPRAARFAESSSEGGDA